MQLLDDALRLALPLTIHTLQSHDYHTWWATNPDKMATNSGQPVELQPCQFPILQSIYCLLHMSPKATQKIATQSCLMRGESCKHSEKKKNLFARHDRTKMSASKDTPLDSCTFAL